MENDVFYVNEVCNQYKIPSSIEISRSGNGAHLWIFFLEPISAIQARKLGVLLLELSMNKNHSLNISSFDRMFPIMCLMKKNPVIKLWKVAN